MIHTVIERLDRIERLLDGKLSNRFRDLKQVTEFVSCSRSTIYRAISRGELKCSKKLGKLLFMESDVKRWING